MDSCPDVYSRCVIPEVPRRKAGTKKLREQAGLRSFRRNDRCDPGAMMAPKGMGLVSRLMPTLPDEAQGQVYDYAGGFKAINSR